MALNLTAAWLEARHGTSTLHFSAALGTSQAFLAGPGGVAADGVPAGCDGRLVAFRIWDGSTMHTVEEDIAISAGDRISVEAVDIGGSQFAIAVQVNYASTPLSIAGIAHNATVQATITQRLEAYA